MMPAIAAVGEYFGWYQSLVVTMYICKYVFRLPTAIIIPGGTWDLAILPEGREKA